MLMQAAVLHEESKPLVIEDVELRAPQQHEVLVRIGAAGICRSDYHFMVGHAHASLPAILGHEGAGTVEAVGEGVTRVKPGDRVILSFVPNCGYCHFCETGRPYLCDTALRQTPGVMMDGTPRLFTTGGQPISNFGKMSCFAQYSVVPESGCIPVSGELPIEVACFIGCCVTTGVGAVLYNAQVKPGQSVAVVGCGGVGLNVLQGAAVAGADPIIAVDISNERLEFARQFGATHTVNPRQDKAISWVRELTDGGVDFAFEAYGGGETTRMAVDMARKGGTAVIVGLAPLQEDALIDANALVRQEKIIKGCYYGSARPQQDMPKMVELYRRGRLDIDRLATRRYKLDQINEAYADLVALDPGRGVIVF